MQQLCAEHIHARNVEAMALKDVTCVPGLVWWTGRESIHMSMHLAQNALEQGTQDVEAVEDFIAVQFLHTSGLSSIQLLGTYWNSVHAVHPVRLKL